MLGWEAGEVQEKEGEIGLKEMVVLEAGSQI
jgi:hypothetical protein